MCIYIYIYTSPPSTVAAAATRARIVRIAAMWDCSAVVSTSGLDRAAGARWATSNSCTQIEMRAL